MNVLRQQLPRQLRAGLTTTTQRPSASAFPRVQSRRYATEPDVRYQKGDKTAPWPLILGGGAVVVMAARYFLYSDKPPASDHQHSGSSGVGPAGAEDHKDKYRDKRDTPNKGTR